MCGQIISLLLLYFHLFFSHTLNTNYSFLSLHSSQCPHARFSTPPVSLQKRGDFPGISTRQGIASCNKLSHQESKSQSGRKKSVQKARKKVSDIPSSIVKNPKTTPSYTTITYMRKTWPRTKQAQWLSLQISCEPDYGVWGYQVYMQTHGSSENELLKHFK